MEDFKIIQWPPKKFFIEVLIKKMKQNHCKISVEKHLISIKWLYWWSWKQSVLQVIEIMSWIHEKTYVAFEFCYIAHCKRNNTVEGEVVRFFSVCSRYGLVQFGEIIREICPGPPIMWKYTYIQDHVSI